MRGNLKGNTKRAARDYPYAGQTLRRMRRAWREYVRRHSHGAGARPAAVTPIDWAVRHDVNSRANNRQNASSPSIPHSAPGQRSAVAQTRTTTQWHPRRPAGRPLAPPADRPAPGRSPRPGAAPAVAPAFSFTAKIQGSAPANAASVAGTAAGAGCPAYTPTTPGSAEVRPGRPPPQDSASSLEAGEGDSEAYSG